jgi:asparagine synthetase B (glutamine-hydrolysing)
MSAPIVPLTESEQAEILRLERAMGDLVARVAAIRVGAALRDGIDSTWLAAHA